jgi:hypothetical protein
LLCAGGRVSTLDACPLSNYAKDKFVAPEMSKFTAATIRVMSQVDSEQEHWLSNFILNAIFRANVLSPQRQQMYNSPPEIALRLRGVRSCT